MIESGVCGAFRALHHPHVDALLPLAQNVMIELAKALDFNLKRVQIIALERVIACGVRIEREAGWTNHEDGRGGLHVSSSVASR